MGKGAFLIVGAFITALVFSYPLMDASNKKLIARCNANHSYLWWFFICWSIFISSIAFIFVFFIAMLDDALTITEYFFILGFFVLNLCVSWAALRPSRVAFLLLTFISLNPLLWIFQGYYTYKRWDDAPFSQFTNNALATSKKSIIFNNMLQNINFWIVRIIGNKKFVRTALSVKSHENVFRVIGGIFFILVIFTSCFWTVGYDVESIAFTFSLFSTLFFASPAIADLIVPKRKLIGNMDYDEILSFLVTTNAKMDWKLIRKNWSEEAFLKEDPRLRIKISRNEEGSHCRDFKEPWANRYPDPAAKSYWCNLSYDGEMIDRFILVSVDGARANLPLPDRGSLAVNCLEYKIAQIFDTLDNLDEYMRQSGLTLNDT